MKRLLFAIVVLLGTVNVYAQDIYSCRNANLSFFSSAPMEDIEAKTDKGVSAINAKTGAVYFKVPVGSFKFKKKLMEEHFNENYLETEKYPYAEYKGKFSSPVDITKDGTYDVTVEGVLSLHGVDKTYKEKATITVQNGKVTTLSKFNVRLEDHKIKIPTLVIKNIAEVVEVTVNATYAASGK
ncbi:YceI-like domain-containing protein [Chitinophaga rupis]|uniref:YceI-like domain-containing protein n=1 Tax=Chitinophaga rupis TaxID=573321 RepID=A0A1H7HZM6_9BACT|nr:YceI family protein [Chitinophaga rupis]SEK55793.1 YceI-like domain-containing protein [Chitinophaga rupis]